MSGGLTVPAGRRVLKAQDARAAAGIATSWFARHSPVGFWPRPIIRFMRKHLAALGVAAFLLIGCSAPSTQTTAPASNAATTPPAAAATATTEAPTAIPTPTPAVAADATSVATALKRKVPSITKVTKVTEALDSNKLLGRPGQYTSAAWIADKGATPGETGVDGGATVEVFETAADAKTRSEYILGVLKEMGPAFGTEWHHVKGTALLRVSGKLSPSVNTQYKAAFGS